MSETMVRVTNISDRERIVSWDGMPYAIPAGGARTVSPMLGKHFQRRHPDGVTVMPLTTQHVAPEAVEQTRKCHLCGVEYADIEEFIVHLGPCAIEHAKANESVAPPAPPAPELVTVTLGDVPREAEFLRRGKNGFSWVRVDGAELEVPNRTISRDE